MKPYLRITAWTFTVFAPSLVVAQGCSYQARTTTLRVDLPQEKPAEPFFYYRAKDVVVLIPPDTISKLISHDSAGNNLVAAISGDLPIRQDTDLFKYVVRDWGVYSQVQWLVTASVESGEASITNFGGVVFHSARIVHRQSPKGSDTMVYVDDHHHWILWRLDCIAD